MVCKYVDKSAHPGNLVEIFTVTLNVKHDITDVHVVGDFYFA